MSNCFFFEREVKPRHAIRDTRYAHQNESVMPFSIKTELERLDLFTKKKVVENLDALHACSELGYRSVEIRDDSRLAFNWALGAVRAPVCEILEEMSFIQFLSYQTNYHQFLQEFMKKAATCIRETTSPKLDWTTTWHIVRSFAPDLCKYEFLEKLDGGIPEFSSS